MLLAGTLVLTVCASVAGFAVKGCMENHLLHASISLPKAVDTMTQACHALTSRVPVVGPVVEGRIVEVRARVLGHKILHASCP